MANIGLIVASLGAVLLLGLLADAAAHRTPLPRVTLLMLLGLLAGPSGFDVLPPDQAAWFPVLATVALVMIGFLLGGEFTYRHVKEIEDVVFKVALVESAATAAIIGMGLLFLDVGSEIALSLAGIGAATAPAATLAVVKESGVEGPFVDVLKGTVAVDDVMGIVLFSLLVAGAGLFVGGALQWDLLLDGALDIGGSIALGLSLGVPAAPLTGRIREGEATLEEGLGLVLLCSGLALWLDFSPILAAMVMGASLANLARHHDRAFHEIESIEWPFLVIFFVLAGASLEIEVLRDAGGIAVAYILLRTSGKLLGPWICGRGTGIPLGTTRCLGLALLPQAGVALGLALAARIRFPESGSTILNVVVAGTVVFELVGPVLVRQALRMADGEACG